MKTPIIIGMMLLLRCSFLIFKDDLRTWTFPATGEIIYYEGFVWYISEFISIIVLILLSIFRDDKWLFTLKILALVAVFDLVDFVITGNSVWWYYGKIPVCMNILSIGIFGLGLIYKICKTRMNSYTH